MADFFNARRHAGTGGRTWTPQSSRTLSHLRSARPSQTPSPDPQHLPCSAGSARGGAQQATRNAPWENESSPLSSPALHPPSTGEEGSEERSASCSLSGTPDVVSLSLPGQTHCNKGPPSLDSKKAVDKYLRKVCPLDLRGITRPYPQVAHLLPTYTFHN